jgi:uncharacterized protein
MSESRVLASVEIATSRAEKAKGLLGRDSLEGALAIPHCRCIHTIGMRFPIDVAYVDANNVVIKTHCVHQHRLALPVLKAAMVIEAQAGAFERWGLRVGDPIEIRDAEPSAES